MWNALSWGICALVTLIWAGAYGKQIIYGGPTPTPELSGVLVAVITGIITDRVRSAAKRSGDVGPGPIRRSLANLLLGRGKNEDDDEAER